MAPSKFTLNARNLKRELQKSVLVDDMVFTGIVQRRIQSPVRNLRRSILKK